MVASQQDSANSLQSLAQRVSSWGQADWADGNWHRTHPITLLYHFIHSIRSSYSLLIALIAAPIIGDFPTYYIGIAVLLWLGVSIINAAITWLTRYYRLDTEQFSVRGGVFNKTSQSIAIGHIHALNAAERPYMRPFGVMSITISAAGLDADIALHGVPVSLYQALELLRNNQHNQHDKSQHDIAQVSQHAISPNPGIQQTRHGNRVFVASMRDIILFSVTNLSIFAALLVLYGFIDNIEHIIPSQWSAYASHTVESLVAHGVITAVLVILGLAIIVAVCSIILAVLRWYNFEVWRDGDNITLVKGALTRATATVSVKRIQAVIIEQSLLRKVFRLCTVRVVLGAFDSQQDTEQGDERGAVVLIPVISQHRVDHVLAHMIPEWKVQYEHPAPLRHTGRGLLRYYLLAPAVWSVILVVGWVALVVGTWHDGVWHSWHDDIVVVFILAAVLPLVALWHCIQRWCASRTDGFAFLDSQLICATTFTGKFETIYTRRSRIQSVRRRVPIWRVRASRIGSLRMPIALSASGASLYWHALSLQDTDTLMTWVIR